MLKSELRRSFLAKRRELSSLEFFQLSKAIAELFFKNVGVSGLAAVHCFISTPAEPDTSPIFARFWNEHPAIRTFAPRIDPSSGGLLSVRYTSRSVTVESSLKISEPVGNEKADPRDIDLVLVPLLCFDRRGFRVGYGKGFYDAFLKTCRSDCLKIGLSLFPPVALIDDIHSGDVPLDKCVTPGELFVF